MDRLNPEKKIKDYDEFKKELRKLESSLKDSDHSEASVCKAATPSSEMTEIKQLLTKLNERIEKLENSQKEKEQTQQNFYRGRGRGYRGYRGRGQGYRGRGNYNQQQRPLANQTFQPTCYLCNNKGHIQRNCPSLNRQNNIICYKCNKQANCPN